MVCLHHPSFNNLAISRHMYNFERPHLTAFTSFGERKMKWNKPKWVNISLRISGEYKWEQRLCCEFIFELQGGSGMSRPYIVYLRAIRAQIQAHQGGEGRHSWYVAQLMTHPQIQACQGSERRQRWYIAQLPAPKHIQAGQGGEGRQRWYITQPITLMQLQVGQWSEGRQMWHITQKTKLTQVQAGQGGEERQRRHINQIRPTQI